MQVDFTEIFYARKLSFSTRTRSAGKIIEIEFKDKELQFTSWDSNVGSRNKVN